MYVYTGKLYLKSKDYYECRLQSKTDLWFMKSLIFPALGGLVCRRGSIICISCGFSLSVPSVSSLTLLLDRSCLSEEPQSWCLYSEPWAETERMRHLNTSLLRPVSCISLYSHTDCLLDMYIKVYSRALTIKLYFGIKETGVTLNENHDIFFVFIHILYLSCIFFSMTLDAVMLEDFKM